MKEKKNIVDQAKKNKEEFVGFLTKYNVIQLAVGVVVGSAVKDLVSSLADNLIMPVVSLLTPTGSWREWAIKLGTADFRIGQVISAMLNFLIIALVVFVVVKKIFRIEIDKK